MLAFLLAACATSDGEASGLTGCADVVGVDVAGADGTYRFDVTVASPDTGWDKYADEWQVRSLDGAVFGTRALAHPHVDEQPFTRSLTAVAVPDGITEVEVAARDSVAGYCGATSIVNLPDRS
ncbi:MAG: hypothetical protein HKN93_08310 [Acidimicrobiia bacterium]|nr:hypothetical protein [Acidimicrobiia bacterium]